MIRTARRLFQGLWLVTAVCRGQAPRAQQSFEIRLPGGVRSEDLMVRYVLAGEAFGGWIQPRAGVSSYRISTTVGGHAARGIKGLVYAPGCAIATFDVRLSNAEREREAFICRPLADIRIEGRLILPDAFHGRTVKLQARFLARGAWTALGLDQSTVPVIQVGEDGGISLDGRFQIAVPEPSSTEEQRELQIWARDTISGDLVALLIQADSKAACTRIGGLKIIREYPRKLLLQCAR